MGSDDPSMLQESENLLSRFMRGPSPGKEYRGDRQQLPNRQKLPSEPGIEAQPPNPRVKVPQDDAQHPLQSIPRPKTKSSLKIASKSDNAVTLPSQHPQPKLTKGPPPRKKKQTPILLSSGSESPEPESDSPQPALIRRSRRARAEPKNYYEKMNLYASSESEKEKEAIVSGRSTRHMPNGKPSLASSKSPAAPPRLRNPPTSVNSLLRRREVGALPPRSHAGLTGQYKVFQTWKGASNDIVSLAWAPDGLRFAAGATAHCDEHMSDYNRKNNLVLGNLVSNELHELPDHWVKRPRRGSNGPSVNDPRFFMSITAVQWLDHKLYTASYDGAVKIWDASGAASCKHSLKHDSKVIVMSRSNHDENLLATGTHRIGYWDIKNDQYTPLDFPRPKARKDIELVPTSIVWGPHQATKNLLLAGMSEKEDTVAQRGLLAAFKFREASVEPEQFTPNSQNVFDIAWHPDLPLFAAACTAGQQVSRGTRSVVNIYHPLQFRSRVMELECPALDMNETVFCPFNSNYISAGCTDGTTYVWDIRKDGELVHALRHGKPINQLDENVPREQADTGVNMQLWGATSDQFYTGASDGIVKKWNILRAPEDALVEDVATLKEGIMCGAFSPDHSNLLVGDVSGGIHLLSDSPFSPDETSSFIFKESPNTYEALDPDSGVMAAHELLLSKQIEQHPVFGPGQGPLYRGPFASWARPLGTPPDQMAGTRLEERYEIRQLRGMSPEHRRGLNPAAQQDVARHISLARIRNQKPGKHKRLRREPLSEKAHDNVIDLCSDPDDDEARNTPGYKLSPKRRRAMAAQQVRPLLDSIETIDLTGDSDPEQPASTASPVTFTGKPSGQEEEPSEVESLEEDFWWPNSGSIDPNFSGGDG